MTKLPIGKNKEKFILLLLAAVSFTNIMDFMIMMPLGPLLMNKFQLSSHEWSFVIASYTITSAISGFLSIFIIDNFDRKKFLIFQYIGFIIGTFLVGFTDNYHFLLFARSFTGIFGGIISATVFAIVGDLVPISKRGKAMGIVSIGFSASSSLGVPFGLYLGTKFYWQMPFRIILIVAIINLIGIIKFLPNIDTHLRNRTFRSPLKIILDFLKNKNQVRAILLMVLLLFSQFTIISFIAPFMVGNVGFKEIELSYIYFAGGIMTIFSSPFIGKLSDKYGIKKIYTILLLLSIIPIIIITTMGKSGLIYALFWTTIWFILISGRFIPAQTMILGAANPESRGSFMGIRAAFMSLAQALATLIAGAIIVKVPISGAGEYAFHLENFEYIGVFAVICSLITLLIIRKIKIVS